MKNNKIKTITSKKIICIILWSKKSTCKEGVYGGIDLMKFINYKLRYE